MRPTKLVMEGFGTYRDRTDIDFDGVELFALTGPTGAGKSTIVDAICMALYGSVPRYGDQRVVGRAISTGLNEALVHLDFTIDGVPYTAVRVIRRTKAGGASTKEARLESEGDVLAGNEREVTQVVTDLLGMTFDHFTRCVVLPQGQFAQFLHDKPKDRQELLKQLLDITVYERIAAMARGRASEAKSRIQIAEGRLADLSAATPERRDELAARAHQLGELRTSFLESERQASELMSEAERQRLAADAATSIASKLSGLRVPSDVAELAIKLADAEAGVTELAAAAAWAADEVARLEAQLKSLGDVAQLTLARNAHEQIAELAESTPERRTAAAERLSALEALHTALLADEAAIEDLSDRASAAETAATAAANAATVLAGIAVPDGVAELADDLAEAAHQLVAAEAETAARQSVEDALAAHQRAAGNLAELEATRVAVEQRGGLGAREQQLLLDRESASTALAEALADEASARSDREATRDKLNAANLAHGAQALRAHLAVGEPCPVCEHVVDTLPSGEMSVVVAEAKAEESSCAAALRLAEDARGNARNKVELLDGQIQDAQQQIAAIEAKAAGAPTIEVIDGLIAELNALTSQLDEARVRRAESRPPCALKGT